MKQTLLDSVVAQGMLVGLASSGRFCFSANALASFALDFSGGDPLLVVDLGSGKLPVSSRFSTENLASEINPVALPSLEFGDWEGFRVITPLGKRLLWDMESSRRFLFNIRGLQAAFKKIIFLFPEEMGEDFLPLIGACDLNLFFVPDENTGALANLLESSEISLENRIVWFGKLPDFKRFPYLKKNLRLFQTLKLPSPARFEEDPKAFSALAQELVRIRILKRNAPEGLKCWFLKFWWVLLIFILIGIFMPAGSILSEPSSLRDMSYDREYFSGAPYFTYTFDGSEPLQRVARYAVGRFFALVTTEKMLKGYVEETLKKNDFPKNSWEKGSLNIPPENVSLRFLPSEKISNPDYDYMSPAWNFFTAIISDSVAYLTELYHETPKAVGRVHQAIDIASRPGARILAPFSGKTWTFKDERGGVVIGIVQDPYVIVFMHCDQLLYLDGQEVMAGDPVATIGMTGTTSGPHVHVVTGLVSRKGDKRIGGIRYRVVNPITWFYQFTRKEENK
ncbi:MAG: M23 family metallopeptidase [Fibrobacter sp.]|jgi:murein DD-endopeptidase MepM/ murein hydrolase activator NlpD|nr:M23 family metallopeptidase [Fibrobacter sp.]